MGFGIADNDLLLNSNRRVGKGGVAILCHSSLSNYISPLYIDSDRICGVKYRLNNACFYFIQVLAPSSNHHKNIFREFIDLLQSVISMYSEMGHIVVMGDFNPHLQGQTYIKPTDARGIHFQNIVSYHNLVAVNTFPLCTGATASFVSYGDIYESLIDHILIPDVKLDTVISCEITDDHVLNVSRHRPVVCAISTGDTCFENLNFNAELHIKLKKVDKHVLQLYKTKLDSALLNNECDNIADIHNGLDNRYKNIVTSIVNI